MEAVDTSKDWRELADDEGRDSLSLKLGIALSNLATGEIARKINIADETLGKEGFMLNGRQHLWFFYEYYKLSSQETFLYDLNDLIGCHMRGGNLSQFWHDSKDSPRA